MAKSGKHHGPNQFERLSASKKAKQKQLDEASKRRAESKKARRSTKPKGTVKKHRENKTQKELIVSFELDSSILSKITPYHTFLLDQADSKPLKQVVATRAYTEISTIMQQLAIQRGACIALSWPMSPEWPGLAHALVNRKISAEGDQKGGIRVLQYPASRVNSARYKSTHVPATELLDLARRAATNDHNLPPRFHSYLTLNALEDAEVDERRLNPSLFTLTPLIEYQRDNHEWRRLGGESLKEIRTALHGSGQYPRRTHLEQYANELDDPDRTTEANFRISGLVSPKEVRRLAQQNQNRIDLIVVDARSKVIQQMQGWIKSLSRLLFDASTSDQATPVLIMTDDPEISARLENETRKLLKKATDRVHTPLSLYRAIRIDASPWKHQQKKLKALGRHRQFDVKISGAASLHAIGKVNEFARDLQNAGSLELASELRKLGGFLRGLTDTPVGQLAMREWIREVTSEWAANAASNFAAKFSWPEYRLKLLSRVDELGGESLPQFRKAMDQADQIAQQIGTTELEEDIIKCVKDACRRGAAVSIVVPAARHIPPLLSSLSNIEGFNRSLVELVSQKQDLNKIASDELIIAGMASNILHRLLLDEKLPNKIRVFCSGYGGLKLQRQLNGLLQISEFALVHPQAQNFLDHVEPLVASFQRLGALSLPDPNLVISPSENESDHLSPAVFADFYLQEYGVLEVTANSTILRRQRDLDPPYLAVLATDIREGDEILVIEEDLRELIDALLKDSTTKLVADSEIILDQYLEMARSYLAAHENKPRVQKARAVLQRMHDIDETVADEVTESMVTRWVQGIEEQTGSHDDLKTKSARDKEHFLLFAAALLIDRSLGELFWDHGIRRHRTGKILEGKYQFSLVKSLLCGAISGSRLGITAAQQTALAEAAERSTHIVNWIDQKQHHLEAEARHEEPNKSKHHRARSERSSGRGTTWAPLQ